MNITSIFRKKFIAKITAATTPQNPSTALSYSGYLAVNSFFVFFLLGGIVCLIMACIRCLRPPASVLTPRSTASNPLPQPLQEPKNEKCCKPKPPPASVLGPPPTCSLPQPQSSAEPKGETCCKPKPPPASALGTPPTCSLPQPPLSPEPNVEMHHPSLQTVFKCCATPKPTPPNTGTLATAKLVQSRGKFLQSSRNRRQYLLQLPSPAPPEIRNPIIVSCPNQSLSVTTAQFPKPNKSRSLITNDYNNIDERTDYLSDSKRSDISYGMTETYFPSSNESFYQI